MSRVHSACGSIPNVDGASPVPHGFRSRRSSSASTASRMNCARFPGPHSVSTRAITDADNRTWVALIPSDGLPIREGVTDTASCDKPIPPIDRVSDTGFISGITYGDNPMTFQLDTTGFVQRWVPAHGDRQGYAGPSRMGWPDLDAFTQGYVEALKTSHPFAGAASGETSEDVLDWAFSDLAPETLARIIADCDGRLRQSGDFGAAQPTAVAGRSFWNNRQLNRRIGFPPLTVQLGDDGKVRFA